MPGAMTIWRFPKVGVKPSHPFFHTFFLYKPCSLGYHHFWKPPYLCHVSYQGGGGVAEDKVTTEFALPDGANARKERGDVQPTKN